MFHADEGNIKLEKHKLRSSIDIRLREGEDKVWRDYYPDWRGLA